MFRKYLLLFVGILILSNPTLNSSTTATAVITYTIGSIDSITVSGNPGLLLVSAADAGSQPLAATDFSTTYAVTTNNSSMRISGSLAMAMPTGVNISIELVAPSGASSSGSTLMATTPSDLVTGIGPIAQGNLTITYTLSVYANAAPVSGASNTVTYTISP